MKRNTVSRLSTDKFDNLKTAFPFTTDDFINWFLLLNKHAFFLCKICCFDNRMINFDEYCDMINILAMSNYDSDCHLCVN